MPDFVIAIRISLHATYQYPLFPAATQYFASPQFFIFQKHSVLTFSLHMHQFHIYICQIRISHMHRHHLRQVTNL